MLLTKMERYMLLLFGLATLLQVTLATNQTDDATTEKAVPETCHVFRNQTKVKLVELSNGKKYYFQLLKIHPFLGSWSDANGTCARLGLHLVTIKDRSDLDVVWKHADSIVDYYWWTSVRNVGGKDEFDYRWQDGSKLANDSDLIDPLNRGFENCVHLQKSGFPNQKGYLLREICGAQIRFICQLPEECY